MRNVKTCANGSNIAKHAWSFGHCIDFDSRCVIDRKLWRLGTPTTAPSMLAIILRRFQTSIVFFLKNSYEQREFTF